MSETSGHFERLLVAQCNADRDDSSTVDFAKADLDAKDIFEVVFTALHCCSTNCSVHEFEPVASLGGGPGGGPPPVTISRGVTPEGKKFVGKI